MLSSSQVRLLTEGARALGVELAEEPLERFAIYLEEIARWSKVTDLVSQASPEAIIRKHLLDSLAVSPLIHSDSRLLDLGSGAGFPGLVLAIAQPARSVALLEARRKRVNFLKEVIRRIRVTTVRVCEGRAEALALEQALRESFEVVITRATWSLTEFLPLALPFVTTGGVAIVMKGPQFEKELRDLPALPSTGFSLKESYSYSLPFGREKRQALIFAKECFT